MPTAHITVPLPLPEWLHASLRKAKRRLAGPPAVNKNIDGERYMEWSFLSREMPDGPGEAIDFGCEHAYLSLVAAQKGFHVLACDLQEQYFLWRHPNVEFRLGDFLKLELPEGSFDLIVNCSSVEHVGIAGRYGIVAEQSEGDLEVMKRFARLLKPDGRVLMTTPCGQDTVMAPWCRVYGEKRLPRLLAPLSMEKEAYWLKDETNRWVSVERKQALGYATRHDPANPHGCSYALGAFVLRKG